MQRRVDRERLYERIRQIARDTPSSPPPPPPFTSSSSLRTQAPELYASIRQIARDPPSQPFTSSSSNSTYHHETIPRLINGEPLPQLSWTEERVSAVLKDFALTNRRHTQHMLAELKAQNASSNTVIVSKDDLENLIRQMKATFENNIRIMQEDLEAQRHELVQMKAQHAANIHRLQGKLDEMMKLQPERED